jgi:hypothetical protein
MNGQMNQTVLKRSNINIQNTHEEVFNILTHNRNANQTTLRFCVTPDRMVIIKKTNNNNCWMAEGGILMLCWWEYKLMQPLRKSV